MICLKLQRYFLLPFVFFCCRRFDGLSNNKDHVMWGAAKEELLNIAPHAYADNISEPASACTRHHKLSGTCPYPKEFSGVGSTRPSAREISNRLMTQVKIVYFYQSHTCSCTNLQRIIYMRNCQCIKALNCN